MGKTALLLIDVQRAFYGDGSLPPVFDGCQMLARISDVVERARKSSLPVFYAQHVGGSGHPLEKGGQGWQIHPAVEPAKHDVIVAKAKPDSFHQTELRKALTTLGIEHLIILGNQTEFCVDTTCRRACSLGYKVTLLRDAHSTWDNEHLKASQIIAHHSFVLGRQFVDLEKTDSIDF